MGMAPMGKPPTPVTRIPMALAITAPLAAAPMAAMLPTRAMRAAA